MPFAPVVPVGGLAGLRFVERTYARQLDTFGQSPEIRGEIDHFLAHAGEARTAEALVGDRRLLRVALGAFGLEDEVDKRAFIRRVLEEGTLDPRALANRLADPAWREFSRALGYGDLGGLLGLAGVRQDIVERFRLRQFERAVGESDVNLRLALNFKREIGAAASAPGEAGWLRILGSRPLRRVIEGAYGLPARFATLDIDRQRAVLEELTGRMFGASSPAILAAPENADRLVRRFLALAEAGAGPAPATRGAAALALMQAGGLGLRARAGLFASGL
jgi:hypothetical protein